MSKFITNHEFVVGKRLEIGRDKDRYKSLYRLDVPRSAAISHRLSRQKAKMTRFPRTQSDILQNMGS